MKQMIRCGWALGLVLLAACQQPNKQSTTPSSDSADTDVDPPAPKPWTDAFVKKSILFADVIEVEGPQGMIDHAVLRIEPEIQDASTRTTQDGLLQETHLKPGAQGEVHAFLDNWELVAFQRITILERVGPCAVKVRARGEARFVDQTTKEEQHGAALQFEGQIPR